MKLKNFQNMATSSEKQVTDTIIHKLAELFEKAGAMRYTFIDI